MERELAREMQARFNVSVSEWRVIAVTCSFGPATAVDVSSSFEIDPGLVSRAVASLIRNGLVVRESSSRNRKFKIITETPAGREVFEKITAMRTRYFEAILQDLTPKQKLVFDTTLTTIATRVDAQRSPPVDDEPASGLS
ncbi:MAG: MarR family winged helix-turn-helix transcriptional regulator [Croceibacterium sp.]